MPRLFSVKAIDFNGGDFDINCGILRPKMYCSVGIPRISQSAIKVSQGETPPWEEPELNSNETE